MAWGARLVRLWAPRLRLRKERAERLRFVSRRCSSAGPPVESRLRDVVTIVGGRSDMRRSLRRLMSAAGCAKAGQRQRGFAVLHELRVYRCVPNRLPALLKRFETTTL